jgi:catechol 2,3-dioxygenase-like lactoylglutathione lyase family enzyme
MMDVIHFYRTKDLKETHRFYHDILGFELYKDQGKCLIYDVKIGKIGFCTHFPEEGTGCITFVFDSKKRLITSMTY